MNYNEANSYKTNARQRKGKFNFTAGQGGRVSGSRVRKSDPTRSAFATLTGGKSAESRSLRTRLLRERALSEKLTFNLIKPSRSLSLPAAFPHARGKRRFPRHFPLPRVRAGPSSPGEPCKNSIEKTARRLRGCALLRTSNSYGRGFERNLVISSAR